MKLSLSIVIIAAAAAAFGQGTVMVDTNTGVLRYPTNFVPANDLATETWSTGREAAVRADITSAVARISGAESSIWGWQRDSVALGSNAVVLVTTNYFDISGAGTPSVAGTYWKAASTNVVDYRGTNGFFVWYGDEWGLVLSTNINVTNGPSWYDYYLTGSLEPLNGSTGTLTWAESNAVPCAQIGAGTNDMPGSFKWRGQLIADGTLGIYIGGRWVTNSAALAFLTATNDVLLWRGIPLCDSNAMSFVGGELWTNRLMLTNLTFITGVSTNVDGEIQTITGTAAVVRIK